MEKSPEKIKEIFEHHLPYEIDRLSETYDLLSNSAQFSRCLDVQTMDTVADSLVVAFCTHAKNLIEFLSRKTSKDYASPSDYAENYQPWKIVHKTREHLIKGKLNGQLSHLTFDRTADFNNKIGADDRAFMLHKIKEELERWIADLRPEYNPETLPIRRLDRTQVPVKQATLASTNHTTAAMNSFGWTGPSKHE